MKKTGIVVVSFVLVVTLGTAVFSVDVSAGRHRRDCVQNCVCIDENGDGICDIGGKGCAFVDEDGDGICDNRGTKCACVDENGDGICDNRGTGCANGTGQGLRSNAGGHCGKRGRCRS